MVNYLVHVIDEISNHKKDKDGIFKIFESEDDQGNKIHVLRTDAFYTLEAEKSIEAVAMLTKLIKIEDEQNCQSSLSEIILKNKKSKNKIEDNSKRKIEDNEDDENESDNIEINSSHYNYDHATTSDLMFVSCKIKRKEKEDEWIEYHKISFYVIEENKIMQI